MAKILKENKIIYYLSSYLRTVLPSKNFKVKISALEKKLSEDQLKIAKGRVDYYCKLNNASSKLSGKTFVKDLQTPKNPKTYYFDAYKYARYFDENLKIDFLFGDVVHVPETPSLVKSRPINGNNENSVLLKLNYARHFRWIKNDKPFSEKKNILIGRAAVYQQNRVLFFEKYFNHPLCDLGQVNKVGGNPEKWLKPKISIEKQLENKFILSLEGNDVATNLKWIMSSNSIAVMPKPKFETWFMEGKLEGGKHYIEIADDFSDLEEQLNLYIQNPQKAEEIVKNANHWCSQFMNQNLEDYCNLKVLEKLLFE